MTSNAQPDRGDPARSGTGNGSGADAPPGPDRPAEDQGFAELRAILIGGELAGLDEVRRRLEPDGLADAVGEVLPEAITRRTARDDGLTAALTPTIVGAVRESVRKDAHVLVDALFPVMGPAIRKAVASAIGEMVQALNRSLEHSFSIRGLRWRLEAMRTGKSFAEIVFLHSLVFRVEQIFLIHTETGLLLQHVVAPGLEAPDGDLVSGMLQAIQDLSHDSLGAVKGDELEAVRVGALRVWIERGPHAAIAGVIRGEAPNELRNTFQDALGAIHAEHHAALEAFAGDPALFEACRPRLEECFQERYEAGESKPSPVLVVLASALALLVLGVAGAMLWHRYVWGSYVAALRSQPGIVVTNERIGWRKYEVAGLRDPLAKDPAALLADAGVDPSDVDARWEPYQSYAPEFLAARAEAMLGPPATVTLRADNGTLVAEGLAPHAWIEDARRLVRLVPGVAKLDVANLRDQDEINRRLEATLVRFETNTADVSPGQEAALTELAATLRGLQATPEWRAAAPRFEIVGHTDSSGSEATNARLSEERAQRVIALLGGGGVDVSGFSYKGVATSEPVRAEKTAEDAAFNRSVTIRVVAEKR